MRRTVHRTEAAIRDVAGHLRYIRGANPRAARRVSAAIEKAFRTLLRMPFAGASCEYEEPEIADLRYWTVRGFENYVILYRPIPAGIEIARVVHSAQDPLAIFPQCERKPSE
jgi:plasmid stabilization system protein ParE